MFIDFFFLITIAEMRVSTIIIIIDYIVKIVYYTPRVKIWAFWSYVIRTRTVMPYFNPLGCNILIIDCNVKIVYYTPRVKTRTFRSRLIHTWIVMTCFSPWACNILIMCDITINHDRKLIIIDCNTFTSIIFYLNIYTLLHSMY